MKRSKQTLPLFLVAAFFAASAPLAQGQERSLPQGPPIYGHGTAWPSPWLGLDGNPAGLGATPGEIGVWGGRRLLGGGLGLSLGGLKLSSTVDYLMPSGTPELWRYGLGLALAPSQAFVLAGYWKPMWQTGKQGAELDGWSLGTLIRPARWLSLGFEAHNLGREHLGAGGNVLLAGGFALRPFGDRFTIGADCATSHDADFWDISGFFGWEFLDGIRIGASGGAVDVQDTPSVWAGGSISLMIPHGQSLFEAGVSAPDSAFEYLAAGRLASQSPARTLDTGAKVVRMTLAVGSEMPGTAFFAPRSASLLEQRLMLQKLARDPDVAGVVIRIQPGSGGWAAVQEVGRSLAELRASGKQVVAYLYGGSNKEYYLASFAHRIVVHPAAVLSFTGIRATMTFFADLLASLGVQAQFVRIGPWKGYPESFTNNAPSPQLLESQTTMLDDVYAQLLGPIASNRSVTPQVVQQWVDAGPQTPRKALAMKMIDEVSDLDEMKSLEELGLKGAPVVNGYPFEDRQEDTWGPQADVAVLILEGTLVDGPSGGVPGFGTMTGADDIVPLIKSMEKDPGISAVLVRVNSPGGSPLASDRILTALKALAKAKPVVISMGDVAASGGYYLSMSGAKVLAMPGTITGSIGIYFGKFVISGLLDRLQIRRTHLERGQHSGWNDMDRPLTPEDLAFAQERLAEYYDLFLHHVETARSMQRTELEKLAEGRVFCGERALKYRLVDQEGGVLEALQILRETLDVDADRDVSLQFYPRPTFAMALQKSFGLALGVATAQQLDGVLESLGQLLGARVWAMDPSLPLAFD